MVYGGATKYKLLRKNTPEEHSAEEEKDHIHKRNCPPADGGLDCKKKEEVAKKHEAILLNFGIL